MFPSIFISTQIFKCRPKNKSNTYFVHSVCREQARGVDKINVFCTYFFIVLDLRQKRFSRSDCSPSYRTLIHSSPCLQEGKTNKEGIVPTDPLRSSASHGGRERRFPPVRRRLRGTFVRVASQKNPTECTLLRRARIVISAYGI